MKLKRDAGLHFASPVVESSGGVALEAGPDGTVYALIGMPPRLVAWNPDGSLQRTYDLQPGEATAPADLALAYNFDLLLADPWTPHGSIPRFNRLLQPLPPVEPDYGGETVEPVSICRGVAGDVYLLNRVDGDVWRVTSGGGAAAMGWNFTLGGRLRSPVRLAPASDAGLVLVLDRTALHLYNPVAGRPHTIELPLTAPRSLAAADSVVWVAGDGIALVSLKNRSAQLVTPRDTLALWGCGDVADILPLGGDRLIILPLSERGPVGLRIIRR